MAGLRVQADHGDAGETLIEALVSISILGIAVVALLGSILIGVKTSLLHREHAQVQAELRTWAERVSADSYDPCATAGQFPGPSGLPAGLSGSIQKVQHWNGTAFADGCGTDLGLQKVTLQITAAPGIAPGFSKSLDVVVRQPCATSC